MIDLDGTQGETVRVMGRVIDASRETLHCGLPVSVHFEEFDEEVSIPVWRQSRGGD